MELDNKELVKAVGLKDQPFLAQVLSPYKPRNDINSSLQADSTSNRSHYKADYTGTISTRTYVLTTSRLDIKSIAVQATERHQ